MTEIEYRRYINMLNQWLILKHICKGIDKYLLTKDIKKIAIYGMGIYGRHLVRELQNSDVTVAYGIDRKELEPYNNVEIFHISNKLSKVDAIVNTVILEHEPISKELKKIFECPVISLEDLVFESYE